MEKVEEPTVLFGKSKWIWAGDGTRKNSHVIIRKTLSFGTEKPPARALCRAACDSRYSIYVNGNAAVWCSGLRAKRTYYDEFDIAKLLTKGDNVIVVYCEYDGQSGRDLVVPARAGFIFECNDLGIYSDDTFTVYENPAYKTPRVSNCCYAGSNVLYDASYEGQIQNVLAPSYNSSLFVPATVLSDYPDSVNGTLSPRPIPMERFSAQPVIAKYKKSTNQYEGDTYTIPLPREMRVTPYFEVTADGKEKIKISTNRTACQGTFGDEASVYNGHSIEYIAKSMVNIFECMLPMTGDELVFTMPHTVRVLKLGYREIGYDTDPTCDFETGDERLDRLFDKALNTLYACMGSTIMDTPERDRSLWLGDGSIASRALCLAYADATGLVKKAIDDVMEARNKHALYSCVPGNLPVEIPAQGLFALGEYGIFAQYRNFTTDLDTLRREYEKLCDYLMLWEMTEHGVALRDGTRRWYDNLYNVDETLIENALYYSACKFLTALGKTVGNNDYEETFDDRMNNIAEYIESRWDGLGYISRDDAYGYDERANALIVLCGLVPDERKDAVTRLLAATYTCSPFFEWAVIEALGKLGKRNLALRRFESRYATLADDEGSTLGEDFNNYGTRCHCSQSAVITELVCVLGGIEIKDGASRIRITPDFTALKDFKCKLKLASGELEMRYKYSQSKIDMVIENRTNAKVVLNVVPEFIGRPTEHREITLNNGKNKFSL